MDKSFTATTKHIIFPSYQLCPRVFYLILNATNFTLLLGPMSHCFPKSSYMAGRQQKE
jgi:hypothetical protein